MLSAPGCVPKFAYNYNAGREKHGLYTIDYTRDFTNSWQKVDSADGVSGGVKLMQYAMPDTVMAINVPVSSLCDSQTEDGLTLAGAFQTLDGGGSGAKVSSVSAGSTLLKLLVRSRNAPKRVKRKFQQFHDNDSMLSGREGSQYTVPVCGYVLEGLVSPHGTFLPNSIM